MTHTTSSGTKVGGAIIGGLVGLCIGPFVGTPLVALASGGSAGPELAGAGGALGIGAGAIGGALLGAFLVGRPQVAAWCLGMAFAVGAIAFLAGFVGPILLVPDSPQGPLLGIFITGPLGFVVGGFIGLFIGLAKERRRYGRTPA